MLHSAFSVAARLVSLALAFALLGGTARAHPLPEPDELLVTGFTSANLVRYDAETGAPIGGLGPGGLVDVLGAAVGLDGNLYVCSEGNDRVVRFDVESGAFIDNFIIDDPLTPENETGGLNGPSSILFGRDGFAYVASFNNDRILRYDAESGAFDRIFVTAGQGNLDGPDTGMSFGPDGHLYVPSFFTDRVKRYDGVSGASMGNLVAPGWANIKNPRSVIFPGDGFAYVASEGNDRVLKVDAATGQASVEQLVFDRPGTPVDESGGLDGPTGLGFGPDGLLYVGSVATDSVLRYQPDGTFVDEFVAPGLGGLQAPTYLSFRPDAVHVCFVVPNSTGRPARIGVDGFSSIGADDFQLTATSVPPGVSGLFFYGRNSLSVPFGNGIRCVGGSVFRLAVTQADGQGWAAHALDFANPPRPGGRIQSGSSWYFQFWFRDPAGAPGLGYNTSDALRVVFSD